MTTEKLEWDSEAVQTLAPSTWSSFPQLCIQPSFRTAGPADQLPQVHYKNFFWELTVVVTMRNKQLFISFSSKSLCGCTPENRCFWILPSSSSLTYDDWWLFSNIFFGTHPKTVLIPIINFLLCNPHSSSASLLKAWGIQIKVLTHTQTPLSAKNLTISLYYHQMCTEFPSVFFLFCTDGNK